MNLTLCPGEGVREILQHPPRDGLHIAKRPRAASHPRQRPRQSNPAPALLAILIPEQNASHLYTASMYSPALRWQPSQMMSSFFKKKKK